METILRSDIFFFISSISVIVITLLLVVILIFVIVVLSRINRKVKRFQAQLELVKDDIVSFKEDLLKSSIFASLLKLFLQKSKSRSKKK
ncbi:hypothetical protein SDC9_07716 [bioreactor metagenome]|uniref:Uncharacterized protein n=1 Tax=bioreactor metagenome TaxID=1076179 RepID=A0A644T6J7_9ZZZZ|nr:hypothetical protein [Candidatus Elulimicrobiales bacterium]